MSEELKSEIEDLINAFSNDDDLDLETFNEQTTEPIDQEEMHEETKTAEESITSENQSVVEDQTGSPISEPPANTTPALDATEDPNPVTEVGNELASLRAQNEALLKQLEEVSRRQEIKSEEKKSFEFDAEHYAEVFKDLNLDNVIDSEENFKKFLLNFASAIHKDVAEKLMPEMPRIATEQVQRQLTIQEIREEFYKQHKVLNPVRSYVAQIANIVAQEDPTKSLMEVLEESAKRAKQALNLTDDIQPMEEKSEKKKTPAFVEGGNAERGKPKVKIDPLQAEISELMNL